LHTFSFSKINLIVKLFDVPAGKRVRLLSHKIVLELTDDLSLPVITNVIWEGTVTDRYFYFHGQRRRLIINPSLDFWKGYGVWALNVECEKV
jgi:hypothetical protein